ncbi:MAG: sigma 54-interacting transcriptional regulator [Firmicutes bacterium]|nr:sigma 54-interacting transcriptional regulator [Bacillota bacterium]
MLNDVVIRFLYSAIAKDVVERAIDTGRRVLTDCFGLSCLMTMCGKDSCLLLLDRSFTILAVHAKDKPQLKELVGKCFDISYKPKIDSDTVAKFVRDLNEPGKVILYFYHKSGEEEGLDYYLCFATDKEEDDIPKFLVNTAKNINDIAAVVNKYNAEKKYELLVRFLDHIEDGISACDKDGRFVYVNKMCCEMTKTPREEFIGRSIDEFVTNSFLLKILNKKTSIVDYEYFLKFKGNAMHLYNSGYPVFDDSGNIIGAIDIFRSMKRSRKLANTIAGYEATFRFDDIIGESPAIKERISLAKTFSQSTANILIQGESGTGKELFAQAIHNYSARKSEPFVAVNCANFPNELIDSELFGYEEGAFTGARKGGKPGKFELANGGTLFLDEVSEMPIHLQAKLLRVLETTSITRIGGSKPFFVNVRVIAATNRDLEEMVRDGKFRADLYFRLKVLYISIPPLRERREDIQVLADSFLKKLGKAINKEVEGIDPKARRVLSLHSWPGNAREMENTLSRALCVCKGKYITEDDLLVSGLHPAGRKFISQKEQMDTNRKAVMETLKLTGGNKRRAANLLGVSRQTIYRLLED